MLFDASGQHKKSTAQAEPGDRFGLPRHHAATWNQ